MKYRANRGGHAPAHLRQAFELLLECWMAGDVSGLDDVVDLRYIFYDQERASARRIIGQLWNCTDVLPGMWCSELDLLSGSTYAQGARRLKEALEADR